MLGIRSLTLVFSQWFRTACLALLLAGCSLGQHEGKSPSVPTRLTLRAPLEWQVTQRQTEKLGSLKVSGYVPPDQEISWQLSGRPREGALPEGWHPFPGPPPQGEFTVSLPVPAGGWYRLDVRAMKVGKVVDITSVEHVGIGEVFVVAGQSNAANHGSERQRTRTGFVSSFDGNKWVLCADPQRGASGSHGSFMPPFGDAISNQFGVPVAVVPVAVGSTSVREWLPEGKKVGHLTTSGKGLVATGPGKWKADGILFDKLTSRFKELGPRGFRAVLWHQGESDVGQARGGAPADRQISPEDYTRYMTVLVHAAKKAAGWEAPWFSAEVTYHNEPAPADEAFRKAQRALWAQKVTIEGPDTDKLRVPYRDGIHFNGLGLRKHGEVWAAKVTPWLKAQLKNR